ncbi:hypothetical protein EC988_003210 [Linderina pennispora]|nr:hypothetical protein EC988_003210 [Linderina pennispora]
MCFTILCTDDFTQTSAQAVTAARRMLFEFGGIPRYAETKLLFETPTAPTVPLSEQPAAQRKIELSGRHDGLVIYVSRILQPVWQELATVLRKDAMNKHHVEIGIGAGRLLGVQQRLQRLQHFLTTNQRFVPDQINQLAESLQQTPEGNVSACWQAEAQSLASLYDLVVLAIETISLLSLIQDFDLPRISAEAMSSEKRSELSDLKFHTLVCTKGGREACRALIVAVINAQIKQHSSIASISDALRLRCASIFSAQDVSLYKAMELLNLASEASEPAEQRELANNALELLRDISGTLILDNVRYVFGRFVKLNMRAQAVDLALMCAKGVDPKDQALAFWRDRAPANDKRQELYEFRTSCYQLVLDDLAETANVSALRLLPTDDALFCFRLYDWLLDRGQTTTLYELGGPLLEEYFAVADQRDMLWHLYVHEGRFAMAAVVQRDLACQPGDLKLARRIEYLSLAISNVKIAIDQMDKDDEASDQLARVLRETEDMLEVAQTQMELQRLAQSHTEVAKRLDRQLYDVSALYQDFAEPLQLPEAKLLIFKVSCHDDPEQVTEVWEELLRSTLSDPLRTGLMAVAAKISELVPRLLPSSSAVPVNGLVAVLVRLASERPAEYVPGYICDSLVLAGVPYQAVFESLVRVHRKLAGDPSLAEMLVREVVYLAGAWLANAGEDVPTMYVDEVISQYIVQANVAKNQALQSDLLKAQEKVRQVL